MFERHLYLRLRRTELTARRRAAALEIQALLRLIQNKGEVATDSDVQSVLLDLVREFEAVYADLQRAIQEIDVELGSDDELREA